MAYDKLERPFTDLVGAGATVTDGHTSTLQVLDFGGSPVQCESELRIGGSVTGTNPTLDVKYQESTTGTGSWTDIAGAAHKQQTATMQNVGGGVLSADPDRISFRTTKRYVKAVITVGGTSTPTFNGVSLATRPTFGARPTTARG